MLCCLQGTNELAEGSALRIGKGTVSCRDYGICPVSQGTCCLVWVLASTSYGREARQVSTGYTRPPASPLVPRSAGSEYSPSWLYQGQVVPDFKSVRRLAMPERLSRRHKKSKNHAKTQWNMFWTMLPLLNFGKVMMVVTMVRRTMMTT